MSKKLTLGFLLLILVGSLLGCSWKPGQSGPQAHVYSHRGASGEETEHTFDAYDLAILYGSIYIEQDIVLSMDGTLYVSHDLSAERMTGTDKLFREMSDEEIDALTTTDGHQILKLSDVFDRYQENQSVIYVVELKDFDAVEPFIQLVDAYDCSSKIIVQCQELQVLETLSEQYPKMKTLYLVPGQADFDAALSLSYVDILSVNVALMSEANCSQAHAYGKEFNVWTLNSMEEIKRAIDLGVDTYFTNYTAKALALEEKYRK